MKTTLKKTAASKSKSIEEIKQHISQLEVHLKSAVQGEDTERIKEINRYLKNHYAVLKRIEGR
jgi:hypothetical protein